MQMKCVSVTMKECFNEIFGVARNEFVEAKISGRDAKLHVFFFNSYSNKSDKTKTFNSKQQRDLSGHVLLSTVH